MTRQVEFDRLISKVAANIKKYRKISGLTQMDMVDHGFNYRHYQKLESGKVGYNLLTLFRLSKIFKVSLTQFFED